MPEVFFAGSYCRGFLYSPLYHFESGVLIHVKEAVSGEEIERSLQKTLSCNAGKFLSLSTCREQRREVLSTFQDGCQTIYEFRTGCRILGFFLLRDTVRPAAADTLAWFRKEGVSLRIMSGDDPRTVAAVARRLGLPEADRAVDCGSLSDEELIADGIRRSSDG